MADLQDEFTIYVKISLSAIIISQYKTIDPEGGALEMIIKTKEQIGGPLEQFGTVGYKFETNGATVVSPERVLRVMSTSSYSGTDSAN